MLLELRLHVCLRDARPAGALDILIAAHLQQARELLILSEVKPEVVEGVQLAGGLRTP